jgi:Glycosyltransferase
MRILFLAQYHEEYGSIRSLLDLTAGLRSYDISPFFVIPAEGGFSAMLAAQGFPFKILSVPWWMSAKDLSPKSKLRAAREIRSAAREIEAQIRAWKIDLVYTNSSVTPVGRLAAKRAGLPHIWHIREYGDLDFNLRFIFPSWLSQRIISGSEAVICHAKAVQAHHFKRQRPGIHQIYNGVASLPVFDERLSKRQSTPTSEPYTFLMLSAITPKKGQEQAIRALASLRGQGIPARLILAGSGRQDYLSQLQALVAEQGWQDWVSFPGFVTDPFPLYYQADCALVCSEYEAFSRVALEAMSTALPVIGRNSGGTPEIIVDGETGLLYNTFDELVEAMRRLAQDWSLSRKMGLAGWERARELFSIEQCAASVYQVIQSVMSKA